jgi:hypothetical protein
MERGTKRQQLPSCIMWEERGTNNKNGKKRKKEKKKDF